MSVPESMAPGRMCAVAVMVAAGLASLATSQLPAPPPTTQTTIGGVAELSTERPVAVQVLEVRILTANLASSYARVSFDALVELQDDLQQRAPEMEGRVGIVIAPVKLEGGERHWSLDDPGAGTPAWDLSCDARFCTRRFGALIEWRDVGPGEAATFEWKVTARVELPPDTATPLPAAALELAIGQPEAVPAVAFARAEGGPVPSSQGEPLHLWRVTMELGEGPLARPPVWPVVVRALATLRTETIVASSTEDSSSTVLFVDEEGEDAVFTAVRGNGQVIDLRPFSRCEAGRACRAVYLLGLRRSPPGSQSSRVSPDDVQEASWELDARVISVDGEKLPVTVKVEPIEPMPMVSGTMKGTKVLGEGATGRFRYRATVEATGRQDRTWDGLPLPTRGLLRARLRSTGSTPIPEGTKLRFGTRLIWTRLDAAELRRGEEALIAFTPVIDSDITKCRVNDCEVTGEIEAGISYVTANPPQPGWQITIDWELEVAVGTTDASGDATLTIEQIP